MTDARSALPPALVAAIDACRRDDLAGAREIVEAAIAAGDTAPALRAFAGLVACQLGDPGGAIPHLRAALIALPDDLATRTNLATALAETEQFEDVITICAVRPDHLKLRRLSGFANQQLERPEAAVRDYRIVVDAMPGDFESWNNLGNAHRDLGQLDEAIAALTKALALRPDTALIHLNLARALAKAERLDEQRDAARRAASLQPSDAETLTVLGLAEASMRDFAAAERAYRDAIAADEQYLAAYFELGTLLENLNRIDDLAALAEDAVACGLPAAGINFLRAWVLRRQGRFAEAMPLAEAVADAIDPIRRAGLIADIADRLGDIDRAFAQFSEMNRLSLAAAPSATQDAADYLAEIERISARLTPATTAHRSSVSSAATPPSPVMIVGFPRSGTTLLDTLLMNLPKLHVLEELPVLYEAESAIGDLARVGDLSAAEVAGARRRYFTALAKISPARPDQTIVDKHPLHMARMPVVHRLFPDARIVFVERHPCDVVLSCFMSNFRLNRAMANFVTLKGAARLYDAAQRAWTKATDLLPITVHRIRYERMVEDLEGEMRPLLGFLGLDWDQAVLDNQGSAAKRGHITTASYAQVTEPVYRRSAGRWERYRHHMEDVLPILAPWAEAMGYPI